MNERPFRFGLQSSAAPSRAGWLEKARKVEALGYAVLSVPDHFASAGFAVAAALTAAASATTTLRLGSFVFANDYRHPVVLAHEAATVDLLSDGRLELGIGAGWLRSEYRAAGLPFDPAGVRVSRLKEAVRLLKALFADGPTTLAGEHYRVEELDVALKPVQRPHPPILVGGGGRRVLSLAALEADIVGFAPPALPDGTLDVGGTTAAAVARQVEWIREAAGNRLGSLELNAYIQAIEVTDDARGAADRLAREFGLPAAEILASSHVLVGSREGIAETLRERRERYGQSYVTVREEHLVRFAPIVADLTGT